MDREIPDGSVPTSGFADIVAFAGDDDEGLGAFVFQPAEVTHTRLRECRIFAFNHAGVLRAVADSFWEWLAWVEANYQFPDAEVGEEEERPGPVLVAKPDPPGAVLLYERACLRARKKPTKRDVRRWLAWNGHTIRHLALAIRDGGGADTLPVLADALEEAGCTGDLLDACRNGDPEIDGPWVLSALLGDDT